MTIGLYIIMCILAIIIFIIIGIWDKKNNLEQYFEFQFGVWPTICLLLWYIWSIWCIIQFIKAL